MICMKQLKRVYARANLEPLSAVHTIDFTIKAGDFICIIGKSGSGKSTLLNMLVGLLRPTSGEILIDGIDLWSLTEKDMAKLRSSKFGYIPQGPSLLSNLTVLDNVRLPFCMANKRGNGIESAVKLLEEMGIKELMERYPSELSGGEMRRAAIARALINNPEILIADEPTSDLDEETTKEVMRVFSKINSKGTTILMVTHEYDITRYGNRLCVMSSGKLVEKYDLD